MEWKVEWKVFCRDEWNGKKMERKMEWKGNGKFQTVGLKWNGIKVEVEWNGNRMEMENSTFDYNT